MIHFLALENGLDALDSSRAFQQYQICLYLTKIFFVKIFTNRIFSPMYKIFPKLQSFELNLLDVTFQIACSCFTCQPCLPALALAVSNCLICPPHVVHDCCPQLTIVINDSRLLLTIRPDESRAGPPTN